MAGYASPDEVDKAIQDAGVEIGPDGRLRAQYTLQSKSVQSHAYECLDDIPLTAATPAPSGYDSAADVFASMASPAAAPAPSPSHGAYDNASAVQESASKPPEVVKGAESPKNLEDLFKKKDLDRNWNEEFQMLLERTPHSPQELRENERQMKQLNSDFVMFGMDVVHRIVEERTLPEEERYIKPLGGMGVLGGEKFIVGNMFVKYARDHKGIFNGDDSLAQKCAMNEIRAVSALIGARVRNLHTILTGAIHAYGHTVIVTALSPINSKTLVYGSDDAGRSVFNSSPIIEDMARQLAGHLNLAMHMVKCSGTNPPSDVPMWIAGDCEGHVSKIDGRFYILDLGRLIPPMVRRTAAHPKGFLYLQFRPEYMRQRAQQSKVPLSGDVFTAWQGSDAAEQTELVVTAYREFLGETLPKAAGELCELAAASIADDKKSLDLEEGKKMVPVFAASFRSKLSICEELHKRGVNVRFLGALCSMLPEAASAECKTVLRLALMQEMIVRSVKTIVRREMRKESDADPKKFPELLSTRCQQVISKILCNVLRPVSSDAANPLQVDLWTKVLPAELANKFETVLTPEDLSEVRATMWPVWPTANAPPAFYDGTFPLSVSFAATLRVKLNAEENRRFVEMNLATPVKDADKSVEEQEQERAAQKAVNEKYLSPVCRYAALPILLGISGDIGPVNVTLPSDIAPSQLQHLYYCTISTVATPIDLPKAPPLEEQEAILAQELIFREKIVGKDSPKLLNVLRSQIQLYSLWQNESASVDDIIAKTGPIVARIEELCKHPEVQPSDKLEAFRSITLMYEHRGQPLLSEKYSRLELEAAIASNLDELRIAQCQQALAHALTACSKFAEAEKLYTASHEVILRCCGPYSAEGSHSTNAIASLYFSISRLEDCARLHRQNLAIRIRLYGRRSLSTSHSQVNLAQVLQKLDHFDEALELMNEALETQIYELGENHPELAGTLSSLGALKMDIWSRVRGDPDEVINTYKRALAVSEKTAGKNSESTAHIIHNMAMMYRRLGGPDNLQLALPLYERSLVLYRESTGESSHWVASCLNSLALIRTQLDRFDEGEKLYLESIALTEKIDPEHGELGMPLFNLGNAYVVRKRFSDAEPILRRALKIYSKTYGAEHVWVGDVHGLLAECAAALGRHAEAAECLISRYKVQLAKLHPKSINIYDTLQAIAKYSKLAGNDDQSLAYAEQLRERFMPGNEALQALPLFFLDSRHPHMLDLTPCAYPPNGQYGCDVCGEGGSGWNFHCGECGWDIHPLCCEALAQPHQPADDNNNDDDNGGGGDGQPPSGGDSTDKPDSGAGPTGGSDRPNDQPSQPSAPGGSSSAAPRPSESAAPVTEAPAAVKPGVPVEPMDPVEQVDPVKPAKSAPITQKPADQPPVSSAPPPATPAQNPPAVAPVPPQPAPSTPEQQQQQLLQEQLRLQQQQQQQQQQLLSATPAFPSIQVQHQAPHFYPQTGADSAPAGAVELNQIQMQMQAAPAHLSPTPTAAPPTVVASATPSTAPAAQSQPKQSDQGCGGCVIA